MSTNSKARRKAGQGADMQLEGNGYVLSNGKRVYANEGIIGLCPYRYKGCVELTEGYDGNMQCDIEGYDDLTDRDKLEIAQHVMGQWAVYIADLEQRIALEGQAI